ncbi:hypothetical protein ACFY36_09330 [Actinoplanes sp. NPDC000266]
MISDLVGEVIGGVVAGSLGVVLERRRIRRAPVGIVRVAAAIKVPGRRWRHGYLDRRPDGFAVWAPRWGRRIELGELRMGRELGMTRAERTLWLDPSLRVFAHGEIKLAVGSADVGKVRG